MVVVEEKRKKSRRYCLPLIAYIRLNYIMQKVVRGMQYSLPLFAYILSLLYAKSGKGVRVD